MKIIMEMRQDIGEIKGILSTLVNTNNVANEALQSARSAHHRINGLTSTLKWVVATSVSICGVLLAIVGFLWKVVQGE